MMPIGHYIRGKQSYFMVFLAIIIGMVGSAITSKTAYGMEASANQSVYITVEEPSIIGEGPGGEDSGDGEVNPPNTGMIKGEEGSRGGGILGLVAVVGGAVIGLYFLTRRRVRLGKGRKVLRGYKRRYLGAIPVALVVIGLGAVAIRQVISARALAIEPEISLSKSRIDIRVEQGKSATGVFNLVSSTESTAKSYIVVASADSIPKGMELALFKAGSDEEIQLGGGNLSPIISGNGANEDGTTSPLILSVDIDDTLEAGIYIVPIRYTIETVEPKPAPVRSAGSPTGAFPYGTSSKTIEMKTDIAAVCRYSTTSGVSYGTMTATMTKDASGRSHSATITGLANGSTNRYYIRCQNEDGVANETDYMITFSVNSKPAWKVLWVAFTKVQGSTFTSALSDADYTEIVDIANDFERFIEKAVPLLDVQVTIAKDPTPVTELCEYDDLPCIEKDNVISQLGTLAYKNYDSVIAIADMTALRDEMTWFGLTWGGDLYAFVPYFRGEGASNPHLEQTHVHEWIHQIEGWYGDLEFNVPDLHDNATYGFAAPNENGWGDWYTAYLANNLTGGPSTGINPNWWKYTPTSGLVP